MAHRKHFTFSLAPEVAHNHNFSLKDNRGRWPLRCTFLSLALSRFLCFFLFLSLSNGQSNSCFIWGLVLSLSCLSLRLDQSITRWRLTVPCRKQQVLWISVAQTHDCTHVLRAVLIAVNVSVRLYIYLWGATDWIRFCECWEREWRKREKNGREKRIVI